MVLTSAKHAVKTSFLLSIIPEVNPKLEIENLSKVVRFLILTTINKIYSPLFSWVANPKLEGDFLIAVNSYDLIYTQQIQPQHLLTATKASITANALSQTQNAQLAEWFLRELDAFSKTAEKQKQFSTGKERVSAEKTLDYVHHIHHAKEQEIRERFLPEISNEQAEELLFKLELEQELEKIKPKKTDIEIRLG